MTDISNEIEKYTKIGLSTDPLDANDIQGFCDSLYRSILRGSPQIVIASGPVDAFMVAALIYLEEIRPDLTFESTLKQIKKSRERIYRSQFDGYELDSVKNGILHSQNWTVRTNFNRFCISLARRSCYQIVSALNRVFVNENKTLKNARKIRRAVSSNVLYVGVDIERESTRIILSMEKNYKIHLTVKKRAESILKKDISRFITKYIPMIITASSFQNSFFQRYTGQFAAAQFAHFDYLFKNSKDKPNIFLEQGYLWLKKSMALGGFYATEKYFVVSKRPISISVNENSRLHNETGPAIEYEDGTKLYRINGIPIPKWAAEKPADKITSTEILKISNVDSRREVIKKVGTNNFIKGLSGDEIDSNNGYSLINVRLWGNKHGMYLRMINPSTGDLHFEGVPMNCVTVKEALAWRNNLPDKWVEPLQLT